MKSIDREGVTQGPNRLGLAGIEFIEYATQRPQALGQVVEALDQFTGDIEQVPPMYSALKKDGKALYEYARQGETIERAARRVRIHSIELISADLSAETPSLSLRVACSKGTYIRTLGEDIAELPQALAAIRLRSPCISVGGIRSRDRHSRDSWCNARNLSAAL